MESLSGAPPLAVSAAAAADSSEPRSSTTTASAASSASASASTSESNTTLDTNAPANAAPAATATASVAAASLSVSARSALAAAAPMLLSPVRKQQKNSATVSSVPANAPLFSLSSEDTIGSGSGGLAAAAAAAAAAPSSSPAVVSEDVEKVASTISRLRKAVFIFFAVNVLVLVLCCAFNMVPLRELNNSVRLWARHYDEALDMAVMRFDDAITTMESSNRGFIITGDPEFLRRKHLSEPLYDLNRAKILEGAHIRTEFVPVAERLVKLGDARRAELARTENVRIVSGFEAALTIGLAGKGDQMMEDVQQAISDLLALTHAREEEMIYDAARNITLMWAASITGTVCLLLAMLVSCLVGRSECNNKLIEHNRALAALLAKANEATRVKSTFLTNISHELLTPMNSIVGNSHYLLQTTLHEEQRECIQAVLESSSELVGMLHDLLMCSQLQAGSFIIRPTPFEIRPLLHQLDYEMSKKLIGRKSAIQWSLHIAPEVPAAIVADQDKVKQILNQLSCNAFKFTARGSISLRVELVSESSASPARPRTAAQATTPAAVSPTSHHIDMPEADGTERKEAAATASSAAELELTSPVRSEPEFASIRFTISDTGKGIAKCKLARIFDAFHQLDMKTTKRFSGTGIGLRLCSQLIQQMRGELSVKSLEGVGSEFTFTLNQVQTATMEEVRAHRVAGWDEDKGVLTFSPPPPPLFPTGPWRHKRGEHSAANAAAVSRTTDGDNTPAPDADHLQAVPPAAPPPASVPSEPATEALSSQAALSKPYKPSSHTIQAEDSSAPSLIAPLNQAPGEPTAATLHSASTVCSTPASAAVTPSAQSLNVLVAEDNTVNAKLISRLLTRMGHRVTIAADGVQAVEQFQQNREQFHVVLMDLCMPNLDGFGATREIRSLERQGISSRNSSFASASGSMSDLPSHRASLASSTASALDSSAVSTPASGSVDWTAESVPHIPIVALTACGVSECRQQCMDSGMDDIISKPLTPNALTRILRSVSGSSLYQFPAAGASTSSSTASPSLA